MLSLQDKSSASIGLFSIVGNTRLHIRPVLQASLPPYWIGFFIGSNIRLDIKPVPLGTEYL